MKPDLAEDNSLAFIWFTPLLLALVVKFSWLTVGLVTLLSVYGALIFLVGQRAHPGYRQSRFFPWLIYLLSLAVLGAQFFEQEAPISEERIRTYPPVTVNGIKPRMRAEDVIELLGQPEKTTVEWDRSDDKVFSDPQSLMAEVFRLQYSFGDSILFLNREELEESLKKSYDPHQQPTDPTYFDIETNLHDGFNLVVWSTDKELTPNNVDQLLEELHDPEDPLRSVLLVGQKEALYLSTPSRRWSYPSQGIEIVLELKVVWVQGPKLMREGHLWAQSGDPLENLESPGPPLEYFDPRSYRKGSYKTPDVIKDWGDIHIGVVSPGGTVESFLLFR